MRKFLLIIILFFYISFIQSKQPEILKLENNLYQITTSVFIENITPEQAREKAVSEACKLAIEQVSGIEITGRTSLIQAESNDRITLEHFSKLTNQTINGIILEKEIIKEENIVENNLVYKTVTVKLKAGKQTGEKDPYFNVDATLNKDYFRNGEEIQFEIKSSKDCFITIFNICSNDSVYVIFPNLYRKDNFLETNETFILPNKQDKIKGISFPVNLLTGKDEDTEMIKIIATKEKFDFSSSYSFSYYGTYKSALNNLYKQIIKIPRNEMEEFDLLYHIYK
ncbi:MAG: DUF4384 domain-containing protein [Candidatus Cloacimonetes bacterium]|nr:DUF4384 domain-containing protein [Candidatus Cloacimonadota bacterium]